MTVQLLSGHCTYFAYMLLVIHAPTRHLLVSLMMTTVILSGSSPVSAQSSLQYYRITSPHTAFPDTGRGHGHVYDSVLYSTADCYSDSAVLIACPRDLHAGPAVDLVFWFHGWRNNIDTALVAYGLDRQFADAGENAVLVLAESARNAPDSYGGKLEQPNTFALLVQDVLDELARERRIPQHSRAGHVILAGHSGAYRVIAGILDHGNVPVNEVILFDALYANTASFLKWITADNTHRFIDLYTDHGGTLEESEAMMQQLRQQELPFDSTEESMVTPAVLDQNRLLFIHSTREHNLVIQRPDNFENFLTNTPFLKKN